MVTQQMTVGILAHVDAGKTTLSESILFHSGSIRKLGRVDHKDAFLDTYELERTRGITIFSKQAVFELADKKITLLDTPGHVDFSAEMERTLQILDYAILVINGGDGVQGHTLTVWKLLKRYHIPVFLFVNKMDQVGADEKKLLLEIEKRLDEHCLNFGTNIDKHQLWDKLAMCDEHLMETYLEHNMLTKEDIREAINERKVFPVFFGSALKLEGVEEFMDAFGSYTKAPDYSEAFGAKIFKITRDTQGNRLTHMKITGGCLKVKTVLTNEKDIDELGISKDNKEIWKEKVDQIRIYSGSQFEASQEVVAGTICAVTGLTKTASGEGLGVETASQLPILKPVLTYQIQLPSDCDVHGMLLNLRQLEEEEPELNIVWNEKLNEIHAQVMGEIEIEILKSMILERYGVDVEFGVGSIVYKESIAAPVIGVGHFEPLRHYAEVQLLLEPGEPGSGLCFSTQCSEDVLDRNWQRLVLTHLEEKKHLGVLTGSEIEDMKITLITGKAHLKHTEGGDFREATYRALRQGLKMAESILLEPIYEYQLEVPKEVLGRALSDIQKMQGTFLDPIIENDEAILRGTAPVAQMRDYHTEVIGYSKGRGRLFVTLKGYEPCQNGDEVIKGIGYDSESDTDNPTGSVFCAHGSGFSVSWDEVYKYKHLDPGIKLAKKDARISNEEDKVLKYSTSSKAHNDKELEDIFFKTYGASKREHYPVYKGALDSEKKRSSLNQVGNKQYSEGISKRVVLDKYLLVDGYNIIFDWDDLKDIAKTNLDAARMKLMDVLCNYQSYKNETVILVFDAYKVEGNRGEMVKYHNIHVVYTKEAETADQYIERLVHVMGQEYDVTVATSDALEQMIIMGKGGKRLSARGLKAEIELVNTSIRSRLEDTSESGKHYPFKEIDEKL